MSYPKCPSAATAEDPNTAHRTGVLGWIFCRADLGSVPTGNE